MTKMIDASFSYPIERIAPFAEREPFAGIKHGTENT